MGGRGRRKTAMLSRAGLRRNPSSVKRDNHERWLLTYSDLITLLLAFFVIMYGISSADVKKFSRLAESMRKAFNVDVLQGMPEVSLMEDASAEARDLSVLYGELSDFFQQEGFADKVEIGVRPDGIAISISGNMLFASGRAELRPDSIQLLHALGRGLSRLTNLIRVEGHTDDVPPAGTEFPTNWELSGARSVAVVRELAEEEGIDPRRLSAVAYSQYRPVAPNDSARSRAKNRRTEVLVLYPAPTPTPPRPAGVPDR
jgi:chemotaxis protein MotB